MRIEELKDFYGTWAKMARKLELSSTTYLNWIKIGYIPYTTQLLIQDKTKGKFKASKEHGCVCED